jgi:hypothetical protein
VSCTSATSCVAVGAYTAGITKPFAEVFGGSHWTAYYVPSPTGAADTELAGVSCFATNLCEAVGFTTIDVNSHGSINIVKRAFAAQWNGTRWTTQSTPTPSGSGDIVLRSVSCVRGLLYCQAAGSIVDARGYRKPLIERWDFFNWSIDQVPTLGDDAALFGVSCTSPQFCQAVGGYHWGSGLNGFPAFYTALVETWNGTVWTAHQPLGTYVTANYWLYSVDCPATNACTAVGANTEPTTDYVHSAFAVRWNGSTWTKQSVGAGAALVGVSCPTTTSCEAVGDFQDLPGTDYAQQAAFGWDGNSWTRQALRPTYPPYTDVLNAVSCGSNSVCVATGDANVTGTDLYTTQVQRLS